MEFSEKVITFLLDQTGRASIAEFCFTSLSIPALGGHVGQLRTKQVTNFLGKIINPATVSMIDSP